jgi:hypothetical protein
MKMQSSNSYEIFTDYQMCEGGGGAAASTAVAYGTYCATALTPAYLCGNNAIQSVLQGCW